MVSLTLSVKIFRKIFTFNNNRIVFSTPGYYMLNIYAIGAVAAPTATYYNMVYAISDIVSTTTNWMCSVTAQVLYPGAYFTLTGGITGSNNYTYVGVEATGINPGAWAPTYLTSKQYGITLDNNGKEALARLTREGKITDRAYLNVMSCSQPVVGDIEDLPQRFSRERKMSVDDSPPIVVMARPPRIEVRSGSRERPPTLVKTSLKSEKE